MRLVKCLTLGLCLASVIALSPAYAQDCTASQSAAVRCFVANAVRTKITEPRHGMSLSEFETYGVAVSHIVQTHHTYLVLAGISSAISDAMPPTNANGSANPSAQDLAVSQIVDAVIAVGFAEPPVGASVQDLHWFARDLVTAMNENDGVMQMLTPGIGLRVIDSYVVTGTSNGKVNWPQVYSNLSNAVDGFINSGLMKLPTNRTSGEVKTFVNAVAHAIQAYKVSTQRSAL